EQHEDEQQRQEAGNFADRLDHADLAAIQVHHFRSEVVEEDGVALQSDGGSGGEDHEKAQHGSLFGGDYGLQPALYFLHQISLLPVEELSFAASCVLPKLEMALGQKRYISSYPC